jgi:hypothetical protein
MPTMKFNLERLESHSTSSWAVIIGTTPSADAT